MFSPQKIKNFFYKQNIKINVEWFDDDTKLIMFDFLGHIYNERHQYAHLCSDSDLIRMFDDLIKFKLIGKIQICKYLQKDTLIDNTPTEMFLITDKDQSVLYIAIERVVPLLWYVITSMDLLESALESLTSVYNPNNYENKFDLVKRFYLKSSRSFNFADTLHDYLIQNNYTEVMLYGSAWPDYPARDYIANNIIGPREFNKICLHAMKQTEHSYSITTRSIYSKSIIKFEENKSDFILEILYNPIEIPLLMNYNKHTKLSNDDLPIDAYYVLSNLNNLTTYTDLISVKSPSYEHIELAIKLVIGNKNDEENLASMLKKLNIDTETKKLVSNYNKYLITTNTLTEKFNDSEFINNITKYIEKHNNNDNLLTKLIKMIITNAELSDDTMTKNIVGNTAKVLIQNITVH